MTVPLCSEYTIISAYRKPPQASSGTMLQNTAFAGFHEKKKMEVQILSRKLWRFYIYCWFRSFYSKTSGASVRIPQLALFLHLFLCHYNLLLHCNYDFKLNFMLEGFKNHFRDQWYFFQDLDSAGKEIISTIYFSFLRWFLWF